jgi:hypothetical protein
MAFTSQQSLDELQHVILLNEALLESLEGDDTEESRRDRVLIQDKLHNLRAKLQSRVSIPTWRSTAEMFSETTDPADARPGSSSSEGQGAPTPNSDAGSMAPPDLLALPSRKRQRNHTEYEGEDYFPDFKSLRPSPALSTAASPASTVESYDFNFDDDPIMQQFLGPNPREGMEEEKRYLSDLERKRKQEKEDEEFARQLAESENIGQPLGASGYRPASSNYTQATFTPDASSFRAMRPPATLPKTVKAEPPAYSSNIGYSSYAGVSPYSAPSPYTQYNPPNISPLPTPWQGHAPHVQAYKPAVLSLTDSDSEIEEISASDFSPSGRQHQQQQSTNNGYGYQPAAQAQNPPFASNQTMPGAFPGAAFAGGSVYGGSLTPSSFSGFDTDLHELGFLTGSSMAGSSNNPLNLDAYAPRLQDYYSDPAKTQEEIRSLIKHIRPDEELQPEDREGTPEQIKYPLMEHQKLGLTWMKKMEEGTNKGGILADDMGLGKTIQALSLIVSRPPPPGVRRPTLVVAPVALMEQWKREAEKMVKPQYALRVFILHGATRQASWNVLKNQDIILT